MNTRRLTRGWRLTLRLIGGAVALAALYAFLATPATTVFGRESGSAPSGIPTRITTTTATTATTVTTSAGNEVLILLEIAAVALGVTFFAASFLRPKAAQPAA